MVHFETLKFRRTLQNYFGQFVWIEKSLYYSRVSSHEVPTKDTKTLLTLTWPMCQIWHI